MVLKHWMKEHGYDFRKEGRDSGSGDIMYELEVRLAPRPSLQSAAARTDRAELCCVLCCALCAVCLSDFHHRYSAAVHETRSRTTPKDV
jgi:hypothetical protein